MRRTKINAESQAPLQYICATHDEGELSLRTHAASNTNNTAKLELKRNNKTYMLLIWAIVTYIKQTKINARRAIIAIVVHLDSEMTHAGKSMTSYCVKRLSITHVLKCGHTHKQYKRTRCLCTATQHPFHALIERR